MSDIADIIFNVFCPPTVVARKKFVFRDVLKGRLIYSIAQTTYVHELFNPPSKKERAIFFTFPRGAYFPKYAEFFFKGMITFLHIFHITASPSAVQTLLSVETVGWFYELFFIY
jgi:hypothetical protein